MPVGEIDQISLLVTENNGPRAWLASAHADIKALSFAMENPHARVHDYFEMCRACIKHRPGMSSTRTPSKCPRASPGSRPVMLLMWD